MSILSKENYMMLENILQQLILGNGSVINDKLYKDINDISLIIYNNKDKLKYDDYGLVCLEKIIMICNILYNRTSIQVLPIEDGFYDHLNEIYKEYFPNFQVGSAVIDLENIVIEEVNGGKPKAEEAIIINKPIERNEVRQLIYDDLMKPYPVSMRDFVQPAIDFDQSLISKRKHNTEHNHPELVGTLDKCKFVLTKDIDDESVLNDPTVKILERDFFGKHIKDGIINPNSQIEVVCELKYDGISVEADCSNQVISARTRGDTGIGVASDMTPILQGYTFKRARCMIGEKPIGVKFEAIMTKSNLERYNYIRQKNYKNCRTAIVGLFGASDAYMFRDLITLVPLALDRNDIPQISNRLEEINFMNEVFVSDGEPLRYCYFKGTLSEILYYIKAFYEEAKIARDYLNFMYDGIVVSYIDENIKSKLGRKNYINKYSMAVKFDPLEKQTVFRGYTYEVGQHGQITPMIHYDPVEFIGTIHTKSTGSSFERFKELGLRYGDFINVKYVNDVMPYVSRIDCDHNRNNPNPIVEFPKQCPLCGSLLVVSDSGKSAMCSNNECPGRSLKRMTNMLQKLNLKGFAEASIKALNCTRFKDLYYISKDKYQSILGEVDGSNMYNELQNLKSSNIKDYIFLGSLGFTSIAHKKWMDILNNITIEDMIKSYNNSIKDLELLLIETSPNLAGSITLQTIVGQFGFFYEDILFFYNNFKFVNSKGSIGNSKAQIRFTGCRNKQLSERLINAGYDADDKLSVTKKTDILIVPYDGFVSTKTKKVSDSCKIIPLDEFENNMDRYLGETI